jgi:ribosomal-protein-alanine N-acetyltransferase
VRAVGEPAYGCGLASNEPRDSPQPLAGSADSSHQVVILVFYFLLVQGQPTLSTKRLTLRPFVADDAFDVERLAGMREIADTTLTIPHPYPHGAAAEWILTHAPAWKAGTAATFAIVENETGRLVGVTSLAINCAHRRAELGYWIALDRWNQGYATESNQRLIDFGFEVLGLHRIEARHFLRNPASGRVMLKLGMEPEGIERDWAVKGDRYESLAVYSILEDEWRSDKKGPGR